MKFYPKLRWRRSCKPILRFPPLNRLKRKLFWLGFLNRLDSINTNNDVPEDKAREPPDEILSSSSAQPMTETDSIPEDEEELSPGNIDPNTGEEVYYEEVDEDDLEDIDEMTDVLISSGEPMTLPLPLEYPHYLRQAPVYNVSYTKSYRLRRTARVGERDKFWLGKPELSKRKKTTIELKKQEELKKLKADCNNRRRRINRSTAAVSSSATKAAIVLKPNKASEYRKKIIKKELIMTKQFYDHYKKYGKPPFRTANNNVKHVSSR